MIKECKCEDWRENAGIIDGAIVLYFNHGFGPKNGLKKSFNYCPWCGKELQEVKEK